MQNVYDKTKKSILHLEILNDVFYDPVKHPDYVEIYDKLESLLNDHDKLFEKQLYGSKERQMILADIIEYIFNGRGYHFVTNAKKSKYKNHLSEYIKMILYFVNLLMCYDSMTVDFESRRNFLERLESILPLDEDTNLFHALMEYEGKIALPDKYVDFDYFTDELIERYNLDNKDSAKRKLSKYYDMLLPKTAGGLWHELLVYTFLIRYKLGYVIPLLLTQRFLHGGEKHLVPPDFLLLTDDKKIYGIEVGMKKEIQSGSFSLDSGIPTATINTIDSRSSDRCPICGKWILFCDQVINNYADLDFEINKSEIRCLNDCEYYDENDIINGFCPFTKYSRNRAQTLEYTHHQFSNGYHYHYKCVLDTVDESMKNIIVENKDKIALKTHYPYYQGLESLFPKK